MKNKRKIDMCACGEKITQLVSEDYITNVNKKDNRRHFCKGRGVSLVELKKGEIPWE